MRERFYFTQLCRFKLNAFYPRICYDAIHKQKQSFFKDDMFCNNRKSLKYFNSVNIILLFGRNVMSKKFNQRSILLALNIGLVLSGFAASNVMAAGCGQAKLIEAGSSGVNVSNNSCQDQPSRIALGSMLELSPGSRVWLKFDPNPTGESFQLICQNRSAAAININVAGTASPWIKPQGLKSCSKWKNNKLVCEDASGDKSSFFCAIASAKAEKTKNPMEVTTSVKMRGLFPLPPTVSAEDVIKGIQPDIELCKNLYGVSDKVEMSWTVSVGIIKDLAVNSDNKDLVACVEGVVKQANSNQDVTVKHSF